MSKPESALPARQKVSKPDGILKEVNKSDRPASELLTLEAKGYRIIKRLGEGSYAKVYHAEYKTPSRQTDKSDLACKIIDVQKAPKEFVEKFLPRELNILLKIRHPHIIHVHSIIQRRSKYYIFMRYAEMGDLLEYVTKRGVVSEPQARIWFRQMAVAIQYLHDLDIAHRDLKCENALITSNLNIKLADFGFARLVVDAKGKLVQSETYCGSLSYAAPEVLRGTPYYPKIADVWSLGVILYVMLNKAMPFDDNNARRLYELQISKRWKFRGRVVDIISGNAKKLLPLLLEPDIHKRIKMDQILTNEWIAMDPRLLGMSDEESEAKQSVGAGKSKVKDIQLTNQPKPIREASKITSVKVLKAASVNEITTSKTMRPAGNFDAMEDITNEDADRLLKHLMNKQ